MQETWLWSLGWEDPLEEGMATHSSIPAWRVPTWTEEPGGLQSMGSQRVWHIWATKHSTVLHWEDTQRSLLPIPNIWRIFRDINNHLINVFIIKILIVIASHMLTFHKYKQPSSGEKKKSKQAVFWLLNTHLRFAFLKKHALMYML